MTQFTIEITSDTVCPWCYIGKKKLEKAISIWKETHPNSNDTFVTTWMPFYLNPDAPKIAIDKTAFYQSKFGPSRTTQIFAHMSQIGAQNGISFKFGGLTGNTRSSHRLIQLGKTHSPHFQTRVVEELFAAYFENEKNITDEEVLVGCGIKAGLGEEEVREWLGSGKGGEEVDREVEKARREGVSGVPNFKIQGKFEVGGAQDPDVFLGVWERIKKDEGAGNVVNGKDGLGC